MTSSRHRALVAFAFAAALSRAAAATPIDAPATAPATPAPKPSYSSLEVGLVFGPSYVFAEAANPEFVQSYSRTGAYGELIVAYRSSYFLDPFLSVGYGTLASGESRLPVGPYGAGGNLGQHLGAWVISPGVTTDIWRFRPRIGLGLTLIEQTFEFHGETHSSSQTPLSTTLGLGFNAYSDERIRFDLESRVILARGADITFMTLDVVLRGDVLYFVSH